MTGKLKKGVRVGFRHKWNYHSEKWNETKIGRRKWKFTFYQVKKRAGSRAPFRSGFPIKGRLHWKIKADQYAVKIGPDTYLLIMKGTKRLGGFKLPKDRRWRGKR